MQFTTSQVRSALGLHSQTLRYWRTALTPLANKPGGKSARFGVGEILALAVVAKLVVNLRVDVGAISGIAQTIFDLCKRPSLLANSGWLYIDIEGGQAEITSDLKLLPRDKTLVLLPVSDMSKEIRERLTEPDESADQLEFSWPLASVK